MLSKCFSICWSCCLLVPSCGWWHGSGVTNCVTDGGPVITAWHNEIPGVPPPTSHLHLPSWGPSLLCSRTNALQDKTKYFRLQRNDKSRLLSRGLGQERAWERWASGDRVSSKRSLRESLREFWAWNKKHFRTGGQMDRDYHSLSSCRSQKDKQDRCNNVQWRCCCCCQKNFWRGDRESIDWSSHLWWDIQVLILIF